MFARLCILSLTLCHLSLSTANPTEVRSDKPLFVPTYNLPNLLHLNPLRYGSLESASLYPQYAYNQGYDYWDSLQRQFPYQDTEKRLEGFLYAGRSNKKTPIPVTEHNEDDYKHNPNKLTGDDVRPDIDHLDLKFKRSLTYTSWTPPTLSSTNNLDDRVQPSASRSVPFGPYTTWLPLEAPLVGYGGTTQQQNSNGVKSAKGSSLKKTTNRRRRREVIYADKDDHLTLRAQPLFIHQEYIPVPIAYSTPIIRNVPNTEATAAATAAAVFPSVAAVAPLNSFYTGKLSATLDTITGPNPDLTAVSYNVVRKK